MADEHTDTQVKPITKAPQTSSSAGVILLQWLTYAFWGWTLLSLVWLLFIVIASLVTSNDVTGMVPYAIAAALVLLPISVLCDLFYGRHEPIRKTGASMVVMIIHAVIFALFGIGMLISGVLTIVQIAIGGSSAENDFQTVWLWTSLLSALVYGLTFLRTLNPLPHLQLGRIFPFVMTAIVGLCIILGFVGPVSKASLTRDDREIVSSIDSIRDAVDDYVQENKALPVSLQAVALSPNQKSLVDRGLLTYQSDGEKKVADNNGVEYRFQLCAQYKEKGGSGKDDYNNRTEYNSYLYVTDHPAGNVCYKLSASIYE